MSSCLSGLKSVFAALAMIALIEIGHAAVAPSSQAERSSYLNWNFNSVELFHKVLIHEKLSTALRDRPDVIQIGDSSGMHGIVPGIVDQYLGGLKYENLSCCANTGFDGYYSIAEFMLRRVPGIKAVVLYMSLNNPPHDPARAMSELVGGEDRLRSAFGPLAAASTPGTLSLRHDVVQHVYNLGGVFNQSAMLPFEELWPDTIQSMRAARGWRPEEDVHLLPEQQDRTFAELCGPQGRRRMDGHLPEDYARDILGVRHTYTSIELRRLAALTARHGAKLILIVQPYPCAEIAGTFIPSLQADIEAVRADYPNLIVPDPGLFEAWPSRSFSSADHLKTGQEDAVSRRAGRLIARALGIAYAEPPVAVPAPPPTPVLVTTRFDGSLWTARGLTLKPAAGSEGVVAIESADAGPHFLFATLPSLPATTYVATITFRTDAPRQVFFQFQSLQWPGDSGHFECGAALGEVHRTRSVVDASIERLPDGATRCSGTFRITRPGSVVNVGLSRGFDVSPYAGDGTSSVTLDKFELSSIAR
jgi:hypothetical protein